MRFLHTKWALVISYILIIGISTGTTFGITQHQHQTELHKQAAINKAANDRKAEALGTWHQDVATHYEQTFQDETNQVRSDIKVASSVSSFAKPVIDDCNKILSITVPASNAPLPDNNILAKDYSSMVMVYTAAASECLIGIGSNNMDTLLQAIGGLDQGEKLANQLNNDFLSQ